MATNPLRTLVPCLREVVAPVEARAPDRELLRRFGLAGDEAAFAEVVRRHGPMLLRVCRRVLHDAHAAEDVAQAVFLLLARKATSIRWHDSVAGWLFQTAYRLALKARGAATRRARHEAQVTRDPQADPVAELTVRELQAVLDDELARLSEQYRAPIVLCCLEGRSRDEAASCLGWTQATVKDRLERGREHLRLRLARRGVVLGTALTSVWLEGVSSAEMLPHDLAEAAVRFASGQPTLAELLPARVATLATGVTTTMAFNRVTILAASLALVLGTASGLIWFAGGAEEQAPPPPRATTAPVSPEPIRPQAQPLAGHRGAVLAVAFSPSGKILATAGADGTVHLWDVDTGVRLHALVQPDRAVAVAFSPDGKTLAAASAGQAGELVVWDAATRKEVWRGIRTEAAPVKHLVGARGAVAFSPDGKRVATGAGGGGVALATLEAASGNMVFGCWRNKEAMTTALAFSPDGKLLAASDRNVVSLNDPTNGKEIRVWRVKGTVTALGFFLDGTRLAVADGGKAVRMLDVRTGKQEEAFAGSEAIQFVALNDTRKQAVTVSGSGAVILWDTFGRQERQFSAKGIVQALAISADGKWLATAGPDGAVLWDLTRDETPLPKDFELAEKDLPLLWTDLASDDSRKVYAATRQMRADAARAVPFLRKQLEAKAPAPDPKRIQQLVADLDADAFARREAATKELEALGRAAESALRAALVGTPSPEVKARVDRLLKRLGGEDGVLTADQLREIRAVRVLEQAGMPEATRLLEALSKDSTGRLVSREAKEAFQRLTKSGPRPR